MIEKPKILIVSLQKWQSIARLPRALQQAGFEVAALCYQDDFLAATRYLDQLYLFQSRRSGSHVLRQLLAAINAWEPHLIIPGDDRTVLFLQRMIELHESGIQVLSPKILTVLRFSFGNFNWLAEGSSKYLTLQRAQKLGLKTPRFARVHSVNEAVAQANALGWPVVVKKSTGASGSGVTICDNAQQVATAYTKYSEPSRWQGKFKSRFMQLRGRALASKWFSTDPSVTINEFIPGKEATAAVVAVQGKVLAQVVALKEQCHPAPKGPSSVVRFIRSPDIFQAIEKIVGHWGATGLIGFDFMMTAAGEANLIECNPRPTFLSYLGHLSGNDLGRAWKHHLAGRKTIAPSAPMHVIVAHFPQEWNRNPQSSYLTDAYHDIPWDDPGLVKKLVTELS